jgi:2-dehydro-3-deoxyphosphooctonate aldolase (KDO 8-P synthase)
MRAIPIMQQFGYPVCFDASHSVQLPGGLGHASGGQREFIPTLTKAAIASGCNCLFIEAHPNPAGALSDKDTVMPFDDLASLLVEANQIYHIVQGMDLFQNSLCSEKLKIFSSFFRTCNAGSYRGDEATRMGR